MTEATPEKLRPLAPAGPLILLAAGAAARSAGPSAGDEDVDGLRRQFEVVSAVSSSYGGVRVDPVGGDEVVHAFADPSQVMVAALDARRQLRASAGIERPLALAVHAGGAQRDAVHDAETLGRASRIRGVAHGGQIVVSHAALDAVGGRVPEHASLVDLGAHRLRDLARAEHLFQLSVDTLEEFPPLASLDALPNNLPVQLTSFVGRERELLDVERLVVANRLVTLTGPGGCGKTRLAAQAVAELIDRYPDGVWWVELAPIADPLRVSSVALAAVGVRSSHGRDARDRLVDHLGTGRVLMVFDNCEHVLDAVTELVDDLLRRAPGVDIVTTSREALSLPGEVSWRVPPLALPPRESAGAVESLRMYDAVRLFIDRAQRSRPDFTVTNESAPAVAEACARLDGIPLAIELAAARVRMMGVDDILLALDDRFRLLTGGGRTVMARQQTLQASVQWSYDLLSDAERVLLRRLSVFSGGFSVDAAERVSGNEPLTGLDVFGLLAQLVDKSLVVADQDRTPARYTLLESIRQFAADRLLEAAETAAVRDAHLGYFLDFVAEVEGDLELGRVRVLDLVEVEHGNLRAAIDWALASGRRDDAVAIVGSLALFWTTRGYYDEGQALLTAALLDAERSGAWAKASCGLATLRLAAMDAANAFGYADAAAAAEVAERVGDAAAALRARVHFAVLDLFMGVQGGEENMAAVIAHAETAGDAWAAATGRRYLCLSQALFHDRHDEARSLVNGPPTSVRRESGELAGLVAVFLEGVMSFRHGALRNAVASLSEAVRVCYRLGDPAVETFVLEVATDAALASGDTAGARALLTASTERMRRSAPGRLDVLRAKEGAVLLAEGAPDAAKDVLLDVVDVMRQLGGAYFTAATLVRLSRAEIATGEREAARGHLDEALAVGRNADMPWFTVQALLQLARLDLAVGESERAEERVHEALALSLDRALAPLVTAALTTLGVIAGHNESHTEAARLLAAGEVQLAEMGWSMAADERADVEHAIARTRAALDDDAFVEAWSEGRDIGVDEAVRYARRARGERKRPSAGWASLTPTESQVVDLAAEGLTNAEIGRRLFISASTVKTHLAHVYTKLGMNNRAQLTAAVHRRRSED